MEEKMVCKYQLVAGAAVLARVINRLLTYILSCTCSARLNTRADEGIINILLNIKSTCLRSNLLFLGIIY